MNPADSLWATPGIVDRLIELHGRSGLATLSMREISEKLASEFKIELTRNAVIGKARRMGLGDHPEKAKPKAKPQIRRRYVRPRPAIEPVPPAPAVSDQPLTIYQLRDGDCRWPLGPIEMRTIFFCGKACEIDRSWCPEHWDRGRIKAKVSWV